MNNSNSQKEQNQRGRPKSESISALHAQRQQKSQQIKQYWTQHRITLIAYECQYIHNKKPAEEEQIPPQNSQSQVKKKKGRKKTSPQFQTGFLYNGKDSKDLPDQINAHQLVKDYSQLNWLFNQAKDPDDLQVKQFIKIMLELKNSQIVKQFLPIYDVIWKEIKKIKFQQVQKETARFQVMQKIQSKLVQLINSDPQIFKKFTQYLKNDQKQTVKLLLVEAYCFLAQKFNFNINQYYSEAFAITLQHKNGGKKVKMNEN